MLSHYTTISGQCFLMLPWQEQARSKRHSTKTMSITVWGGKVHNKVWSIFTYQDTEGMQSYKMHTALSKSWELLRDIFFIIVQKSKMDRGIKILSWWSNPLLFQPFCACNFSFLQHRLDCHTYLQILHFTWSTSDQNNYDWRIFYSGAKNGESVAWISTFH